MRKPARAISVSLHETQRVSSRVPTAPDTPAAPEATRPSLPGLERPSIEEAIRTGERLNNALKAAANGPMKGILGYETAELVSVDYRGDERSSVVDAPLTRVIAGNCVKVIAWYDNEWGYSCRVRDLIHFMAKKGL